MKSFEQSEETQMLINDFKILTQFRTEFAQVTSENDKGDWIEYKN